jgi:Baseplate J-like protein
LSFLDLSSLGYASSANDLLGEWLAVIQAAVPGYVPSPASLEYIDAQGTAAMGSDVAQVGVVVPSAIVRALGTKLFGVPYLTGSSAMAVVQVTAQDTDGPYTVVAGTDLLLNGTAFVTIADLTIPNGSTTGNVIVAATLSGTTSNGFGNPASFVSQIDWVSAVSAVTSSSGGIDPESDNDYQDRLIQELRLQAPRPITAADYATMALSFQPAAGTDQEEVGRATAIDGYSPSAATFVVSANSTATLTVTTPPATGITAAQGASITGTDITSGSLVNSSTSTTIVMSKVASGTGSGISDSDIDVTNATRLRTFVKTTHPRTGAAPDPVTRGAGPGGFRRAECRHDAASHGRSPVADDFGWRGVSGGTARRSPITRNGRRYAISERGRFRGSPGKRPGINKGPTCVAGAERRPTPPEGCAKPSDSTISIEFLRIPGAVTGED